MNQDELEILGLGWNNLGESILFNNIKIISTLKKKNYNNIKDNILTLKRHLKSSRKFFESNKIYLNLK